MMNCMIVKTFFNYSQNEVISFTKIFLKDRRVFKIGGTFKKTDLMLKSTFSFYSDSMSYISRNLSKLLC